FRILGLGRERLATLLIEGPAIESSQVNVMTRPGRSIRVPGYRSPGAEAEVTYSGNPLEHVAGPTRPVVGTVTERGTGKPLAGVVVQGGDLGGSPISRAQATTDERGRYRLVGLRKGREGNIVALPPEGRPYFAGHQAVRADAGADSVRLDIALTRGVTVTGRI